MAQPEVKYQTNVSWDEERRRVTWSQVNEWLFWITLTVQYSTPSFIYLLWCVVFDIRCILIRGPDYR